MKSIAAVAAEMRKAGVCEVQIDGNGDVVAMKLWPEAPLQEGASAEPTDPRERRRKQYEREFGHAVNDEMLARLP